MIVEKGMNNTLQRINKLENMLMWFFIIMAGLHFGAGYFVLGLYQFSLAVIIQASIKEYKVTEEIIQTSIENMVECEKAIDYTAHLIALNEMALKVAEERINNLTEQLDAKKEGDEWKKE